MGVVEASTRHRGDGRRVLHVLQISRATWQARLSGYLYKYFLKVLAVIATLSANIVAKGSTTKLGCRLNGSAR